jgi:hypothetical protein
VFIEDPLENSMATFNFITVALEKGATFTFGSWVCVVDGAGDFHRHLVNGKKLEAPASTQAAISTPSSTVSARCYFLTQLGSSRRSPGLTQLPLVLHQDPLDRIQSNPI